jgi:hypothetical protein|tara:strand:+ start:554 stop:1432 length:879 start_codon:yes stop_codon:yes gene_type:complete
MGLLDSQTQAQYQSGTLGGYQFVSLDDIIDQFTIAYVGEDKLINRTKRTEIAFHAQRALQELSFDTFKSTKSQEIIVPNSLQMLLPQDYVNYVKLSWSDSSGIEHVLYPAIKTSNPKSIVQGTDGSYTLNSDDELQYNAESKSWASYKTSTPSENNKDDYNYDDDTYDLNIGQRYGLDPQQSQVNGSYYIDELSGNIHFSSNISGKTVTLKYISDSLGTNAEMQVHKFAEEAMYKCIAYAIMCTRNDIQEYVINRFKKQRFSAVRTAKLRLSNIKTEEITQILRGKSKQIKH